MFQKPRGRGIEWGAGVGEGEVAGTPTAFSLTRRTQRKGKLGEVPTVPCVYMEREGVAERKTD